MLRWVKCTTLQVGNNIRGGNAYGCGESVRGPRPREDLYVRGAELERLLEAGEETRGLRVHLSQGGLVLFRHWSDQPWAEPVDEPDRRFRLTPLGGEAASGCRCGG